MIKIDGIGIVEIYTNLRINYLDLFCLDREFL